MNNRSKAIFRFSGIDVKIHWTFYLLLVWVLLNGLFNRGIGSAVIDVVFLASAFLCVVLHEFGHAFAARLFGIPTHGITLYPIGGVAQLDNIPRQPYKELVIALAGPAVNVVLAVALFPIVAAMSIAVSPQGLWLSMLLERLLWINVGLVIFNIIPAFPMDGGRVLRAVCASFTNYVTATRIAVRCGQVVAGMLAILGLFVNPMLLLIAAFVAIAAQSELYGVIESDREAINPYGPVIDAVRVTPGRYTAAFRSAPAQDSRWSPTPERQIPPRRVTIVWTDPTRS